MDTRLYDVTIHETTIHRLTVEATHASDALGEVSQLLDTDPDWRALTDLVSGGTVQIHSVHLHNESNDHA
jgi:hypothetical protein